MVCKQTCEYRILFSLCWEWKECLPLTALTALITIQNRLSQLLHEKLNKLFFFCLSSSSSTWFVQQYYIVTTFWNYSWGKIDDQISKPVKNSSVQNGVYLILKMANFLMAENFIASSTLINFNVVLWSINWLNGGLCYSMVASS